MTKIKNTKKGMAKKTLSISLVAAMLATSNVPVWAAEFSDGSDTAVVFSEGTEEAAPAVEAEEVPAAKATGDVWTVKLTDMPSSVEWGNNKQVTVELKQTGVENTTVGDIEYVWKDAATNLAVGGTTPVGGAIFNAELPKDANYVGNSYVLYMYDKTGDWEYTSPAVTVTAKDIQKAGVSFTYRNSTTDLAYTGKEVKPEVTAVNAGTMGLTLKDFNIDYTGDPDLINKGSKVTITLTAVNSKLYTGKVTQVFVIGNKTATADDFELSYINGSYEYTGKVVTPDKSDIRVKDVTGGSTVDGAVTAVTSAALDGGATKHVVGSYKATAEVDMSKFGNYNENSNVTPEVKGEFKVTARNLNNCTITVDNLLGTGKKAEITKNDITFKDSKGNVLDLFDDVDITVPDTAVNSGTYTVTIAPKKDNKNVTGSKTATLTIYAEVFGTITYDATAQAEMIKAEYFTGSQIVKDKSKLIGHLIGKDKDGDNKGDYIDINDYDIEFGENINAGDQAGIVWIVGKRSFAGYRQPLYFKITQAEYVADKSEVSPVVYKENATKITDYAPVTTITAKNGAGKTWTLKEGTDYTVKYEFTDGNKVKEDAIKATITYSDAANNNYTGLPTTLYGEIAYPSITNSDIKMETTSYEYTGAAIVPKYKVYDGTKELKENVDYVVKQTIGGKDVGTATLVIAGMGEYNPKVEAKATFTVTPVSAEKVKVTVNTEQKYDGKAKKPKLADISVTLNGNDVESQFNIVSYGENINAGKEAGSIVLAPKTEYKNFTSGTSKNATFEIKQATLTGDIKVYNERGLDITNSLPAFDYDGTEKTFAKVVFTPSATITSPVTENDYEIRYINNITGSEGAKIIVVAKGNYKADGTADDATSGTKVEVKNVVASKQFTINSKLYFTEKEVIVKDAEYAGPNMLAKPEITVYDGNKVLKEGTDYKVTLKDNNVEILGAQEPGSKTYSYVVEGLGVYDHDKGEGHNQVSGTWKVVKKNVANLDISSVNIDSEGKISATVMNGNLRVDNKNFTFTLGADKKTVTVAASEGNKYYVGSKDVALGDAAVEAPVIADVNVAGNNATVVLSGECDGATGYDYVISKDPNCIVNKDYYKVNKNILKTETTFTYTQKGVYYAYCHAWKRVNGKKVFSDWSNSYIFTIGATTPEQPVVTSVKVSGSTVKVTYTAAANAEGYDVVLGTVVKKSASGETRPYEYGKLVKKNIKNGVVTAAFKNVPKGTYYAGLHAWNRTSETGKKVFSPWSNTKKVTVK